MMAEVAKLMEIQSDQRKRLEKVLAAAHKSVMQTGGLPADSTDPAELLDRTLATIAHNERVAQAYASVVVQVGAVAQASLAVAKAVTAELPDLTQEQQEALQRAQGVVAKLLAGRDKDR